MHAQMAEQLRAEMHKYEAMIQNFDDRMNFLQVERDCAVAKLEQVTKEYLAWVQNNKRTRCRNADRLGLQIAPSSPKPGDVPASPKASRSPQNQQHINNAQRNSTIAYDSCSSRSPSPRRQDVHGSPQASRSRQHSIPYEDKLSPEPGDEFRSPACGPRKKKQKESQNNPIVLSSDEDSAPTTANKEPAAKADKSKESKALAFADGEWHADVKVQMTMLEKMGKLKEADLDKEALKALKTLPYEVALVCLQQFANETRALRNINAFIVKHCKYLRNLWGADEAASSSAASSSSDDDPPNQCGKSKASIDETRTRTRSLNIPSGWLANRLKRGLTRGQARNEWKQMGRDRQKNAIEKEKAGGKAQKPALSAEKLAEKKKLVDKATEHILMQVVPAWNNVDGFHATIREHQTYDVLDGLGQETYDLLEKLTCAEFVSILDTLLPVPKNYFKLHDQLLAALKQHAAAATESEQDKTKQHAALRVRADSATESESEKDEAEYVSDEVNLTKEQQKQPCWCEERGCWQNYVAEKATEWTNQDDYPFLDLNELTTSAKDKLKTCTMGKFVTIADNIENWCKELVPDMQAWSAKLEEEIDTVPERDVPY